MSIKQIYVYINHKSIYNYDRKRPSVEEQRKFLHRLPEPQDDIQAAYNKYRAQLFYYYSLPTRLIYNIGGFFLWPILLNRYKKAYRAAQENGCCGSQEKAGAIVVKGTKVSPSDITPPDLKSKYGTVDYISADETCMLDADAEGLFKLCVKRYLFHPYFLGIILRRLGEVVTLVHSYHPRAIATYARERDFTVPILTKHCEDQGVDYVGFMHGDDYLTIGKVDTRYTRYYVWDQHYVDMYCELRSPREQFSVYLPDKLKGITKPRENGDYDFFMTYYFSAESRETIQGVLKAFEVFRANGLKCKIRPHPRFSDIPYLKGVFKNYTVEAPAEVLLADSIENTEYIAALNSTVLSQAYYSGKKIVIDDYSDPDRYQYMIGCKYIMVYKPHTLLSEIVSEQENRKM